MVQGDQVFCCGWSGGGTTYGMTGHMSPLYGNTLRQAIYMFHNWRLDWQTLLISYMPQPVCCDLTLWPLVATVSWVPQCITHSCSPHYVLHSPSHCLYCCYRKFNRRTVTKVLNVSSPRRFPFKSDSICLQLPSEETILWDWWKLCPWFHPMVRKLFHCCSQLVITMLAHVVIYH